MKPYLLVPAIAVFLTLTSIVSHSVFAQDDNSPPQGFTAIFNGEDLAGWYGMKTMDLRKIAAMSQEEQAAKREADTKDAMEHWSVENGELVNDGHGTFLTTDEEFTDYELWVDYKTVPLADSGIYLKGVPQVQIWDHTNEKGFKNGADKGSGGLWNNAAGSHGKDPLKLMDKPFGEWNRFRIIQVGATTSVWLNGEMVVDHAIMDNYWMKKEEPALIGNKSKPLFKKGPIQLQTHGGEIRWRNIFVKRYSTKESNAFLSENLENIDGLETLINGENLDGWKGALDNYEVVEGAIQCKSGKGGNIFFDKEYSDFVAFVEFRLPPGGNNGLAIRHPGTGVDAAYQAMCELQILDNEHKKFKDRLDPRQAHGSAYGMAAAHKGFHREPGEWNFQQVMVKGSTIQVVLNGNLILDTDLGEITEFLVDKPHPGKDRTSGYFGFAGHNDPVAFRSLYIKSLK